MSIALLFPGQGSQQVGMGRDFVQNAVLARRLFEEANDTLGLDLQTLCLEGPAETLTLTENAQPAILALSVIACRLLEEQAALQPHSAAGHSVGEYAALVAAGALSFADALRAVQLRGRFMQQAAPPGLGAMAALLGLSPAEVEALCTQEAQGQVVGAANFNTPGQIVVSGHTQAVERVLARAKGKRLDVSAPFHSPLLEAAALQMEAVLAGLEFHDARFPIMTNYANAFMARATEFPHSLRMQIPSPVRWDTGIARMRAAGVQQFVELGWGRTLSGMMRRIDKRAAVVNIQDMESLQQAAQLLGAT